MQAESTMTALRIEEFGGPEVIRVRTIRAPSAGPGELLVKVSGAGVNPVDYKIREDHYPVVTKDKLPYVLGRDVAGTVVESGGSSKRFKVGDQLFAMPGIDRGGYAEFVVLKEDEAALKPQSLGWVEAAATPLAALTAWQGLFEHGRLKAGQRVLIHGGSGGVGHFAVQFAKSRGAHVSTTVSGRHIDFVRRLGADQVIDYEKQDFENEAGKVDLVFDLIAGETQDRSWAVLKEGGALVSTLQAPDQDRAAASGVRALRYTARESGADLGSVANLIESGEVKPVVTKTFPLRAAAEAQTFLQAEHPSGKVVLIVDGAI